VPTGSGIPPQKPITVSADVPAVPVPPRTWGERLAELLGQKKTVPAPAPTPTPTPAPGPGKGGRTHLIPPWVAATALGGIGLGTAGTLVAHNRRPGPSAPTAPATKDKTNPIHDMLEAARTELSGPGGATSPSNKDQLTERRPFVDDPEPDQEPGKAVAKPAPAAPTTKPPVAKPAPAAPTTKPPVAKPAPAAPTTKPPAADAPGATAPPVTDSNWFNDNITPHITTNNLLAGGGVGSLAYLTYLMSQNKKKKKKNKDDDDD